MTIPRLRILGIDPGLRRTGFGVIEYDGEHLSYLASGTIVIPDGGLSGRLKVIFDEILSIVREQQPSCAAIEKVFVNVNPQSTLLLGQARGAAICALAHSDLDVFEYTALQIKQGVVGNGRAAKSQVQAMIRYLLRLSGDPAPDAADALACATCHAHADRLSQALVGKGGATTGLARRGVRVRRGRLLAS
jgi:crossover junction endodeoxyribonuclease RuvC